MRHLIALLAVTAVCAAEDAPLLTATLPDGARLRERVEAGIYGRLWVDPAFAPLRARLTARMNQAANGSRADLPGWYAALRHAGLVVRPSAKDGGDPRALVVVDLGARAVEAFTRWRAEGGVDVPAEADAAFRDQDGSLVVRTGTVIASTSDGSPIPAWAPTPGDADLSLRVDGRALVKLLTGQRGIGVVAGTTLLPSILAGASGDLTYDVTVIPDGVHERLVTAAPMPWLAAVDAAELARLPDKALMALAVGIDGPQLWAAIREQVLTAATRGQGLALDDAEDALSADLAGFGVDTGLPGLIAGLSGTMTLAVTPAAPFPAVSLTLPRSPAVDQLVTAVAARLAGEVPAVGASSLLPIAGAPVLVTLARDARRWLITTDGMAAAPWLAGAAGGWSATPAAALALEKAGGGALMIGASDTPTLVRTLIPFVALGLGQARVEPELKQAALQSLGRLAAMAGTGYLAARPEGAGVAIEMRGAFGNTMLPAIIAAIAIPNLLESRISSNEAAAATALKSGIHPAQIQFQSGAYVDANGNGIGDFGFFPEMAGAPIPGMTFTLSLLPPPWNAAQPVNSGYRFAIWLPDGKGGASATPVERDAAKGPAETQFVAYAWPTSAEIGRRMFAITAGGQVHSQPWTGTAPEWFSLWGAPIADWNAAPAWPLHRR